jgi:GTPase SAR1 family protein
METLKVCVFGEYGAGKSTLIRWYVQNKVVEEYGNVKFFFSFKQDPGIEDFFRKQLMVYDKKYTLEILDYTDGTLIILIILNFISRS